MTNGSNGASAAELERRAERERENIARTAEELRDRLTPGQLIDEMMDYFRGSDASSMLHNLKGQVRDNPLALAMVGAGLTWLMAGQGYKGNGHDGQHHHRSDDHISGRTYATGDSPTGEYGNGEHGTASAFAGSGGTGVDTGSDDQPGLTDRISESASNMRDKARASMHDARDAASSALHSAGERASSMSESARANWERTGRGMRSAVSGVGHSADRYARRGGDMIGDLLEREPLVLGAIGVAIGAAIGAMLPSTSFEDEHLGPTRDHLKDEAAEAIKAAGAEAKEAAAKAADAAKKEADAQGLTPGDKPLADKAASVVKAAAAEVKSAAPSSDRQSGSTKSPSPAGGSGAKSGIG